MSVIGAVWILRDKQYRYWRYVGGNLVLFRTRREARDMARKLDPLRKWRALRADLIEES